MTETPSQAPSPAPRAHWHTLSTDQTGTRLDSSTQGLDSQQADQRLQLYGPNRLAAARKRSALQRFLLQFHNILLYVMMGSAVITASLGYWVDTGVLMGAVLINAIIGYLQEGKAEKALDAIRNMLSPRCIVLRDGSYRELDADQLVPGDVVLLASGDRVPADLRLLSVHELRVEEAALTGESLPVDKGIDPVAHDAPLGDRFCMAYAGTLVLYGQATGMVVATAGQTELGRINQLLGSMAAQTTPLLRQIDRFGKTLAIGVLSISALTFAMGTLWRGHPAADMFMMVVALTASAIPEGLPAIITVALALGVQRMARRKAIVRRLPAVEALGAVSVICSDKTGTLTRNEMTVQRVACANHEVIEVSGIGYAPVGELLLNRERVQPADYPALQLAIRASVLCNDASLHQEDGQWLVSGDPTEGALLALGGKTGFTQLAARADWPRMDAIPFESEHRYMASYHEDAQGEPWIFVKGAPERILDMCGQQMRLDGGLEPLDVDNWRRMATDTAAHGLRLLALAVRRQRPRQERLAHADLADGDFVMLALVGIIDPPREEAIRAVAQCHQAGIRVKMITGDHAETARAIGAQLAIGIGKPTLTGNEVALLDDRELRRVVQEVDIFARASPEHKLRLVQALQDCGEVVAMTGDGVNDAPALKRADVGVAMGLKGTEAAKDASDMVLADDHFATIAAAVREGRAVYDNIRKFILFMLPTNGGEALVVIAAILFQLALPLTPAQVLWINMVTSSALGMALAFEPAEPGIMQRPPRRAHEALLSGFFIWRLLLVSLLFMLSTLGLFLWELRSGTSLEVARTMAVNTVVACEVFYLLNSRHILKPVLTREGLTGNWYVPAAMLACVPLQLAYTYLPWMQELFGSAGLSLYEWLKVLAAGLLVFVVAEIEKWVLRASGLARRFRLG